MLVVVVVAGTLQAAPRRFFAVRDPQPKCTLKCCSRGLCVRSVAAAVAAVAAAVAAAAAAVLMVVVKGGQGWRAPAQPGRARCGAPNARRCRRYAFCGARNQRNVGRRHKWLPQAACLVPRCALVGERGLTALLLSLVTTSKMCDRTIASMGTCGRAWLTTRARHTVRLGAGGHHPSPLHVPHPTAVRSTVPWLYSLALRATFFLLCRRGCTANGVCTLPGSSSSRYWYFHTNHSRQPYSRSSRPSNSGSSTNIACHRSRRCTTTTTTTW